MKQKVAVQRRRFLKGALVAGSAAAVSPVVISGISDTSSLSGKNPGERVEEGKGYQLSQHVKAYYRTLRV